MPRRTVEPTTSSTVMVTSSPRQTFSFGRRVMTSTALARGRCDGDGGVRGADLRQLDTGEERLAHVVAADLVDHLAAEALVAVDDDRTAQVDREVLDALAGADHAEDRRVLRIAQGETG